jgi:putative DNA primase/helicase
MAVPITPELLRAALAHIPANLPRDEWARVAMALKSEYPDDTGRGLFDAWSATAEGYDASATASTWRSVKAGGGVTVATLLHIARQHGFELPKADQPPAPPSLAEQARRDAERQQAADHEAAQRQAAHAAAAEAARALWDGASDTGTSPYLARKGVQAHGLRFLPDGTALVPLRDADGVLWNVQRIAPERPAKGTDKLFQKGGRKSGLWHLLGQPEGAAVVLVAEGYATAASLHQAGGWPVAVAFDAGNLAHVAKALHQQHPGALLVVCGDDDRATEARTGTNTGRVKAQAAARAVGGLAVFPVGLEGEASDFNDMHQAQGLGAVHAAVEAAMQAAQQAQAGQSPAKPGKPRQRPPDGAGGAGGADDPTGAGDEAPRLDPFAVDDTGVYFHGRDKDGNAARPLWLCGRLDVVALTRDQDGQGWGYLLQFADPLGRPKQWAMPARMLSGDGGEYRATLLNLGLRIATAPACRNRLTEYIQTRRPEEFASCTDRTGWHATEGGAAYVLPHETIGDDAERIVFQSDSQMENTFRVRKDAAAWRERIGRLCAGNSRLMFAVACAFAGPLLRPASLESGGFHLRGDSSSGKTTALRVAASVNGGPSYMQRWRTTDNALEATAAQHCDALLILDELAQVEGKVAGECAYMLANEQSKARATRGGAPRARLTWRLLFLSAGELGLADHMAEGMKRARTGQEVRMADIPADAGAGMGAFECIHGQASPAAFAAHLGREVQTCHGAPGRAFIEWACSHWGALARRLRDGVQALAGQWVPPDASGQVQRVAARFALVAMAGELATEAGLTGWEPSESEWAARACFDAWLAARGGAGNGEVAAMLRQVRRFLEAHGEGRFTWWHRAADDHSAKTLHRAGFRRMVGADGKPIKSDAEHEREYGPRMPTVLAEGVSVEFFVLPETFKGEVCQGFAHDAVAKVLAEHDCLVADAGRYTVKPRLPGVGLTRCYHITPAIFALDV